MLVSSADVSTAALRQYAALKKSGKPSSDEWTHLAVIVQCSRRTGSCRAVALGSGSKCLSHDRLPIRGEAVHDSHAEVLARRALLRYLYDQLRAFHGDPNAAESIFETDPDDVLRRCRLRSDVYFQLFVSHPPCGDGAIVESDTEGPEAKRPRLERTGAHCCLGEDQDGAFSEPQAVGVLRTKPGRGERTLSLSCSDKLMRWQRLGLQGALLSHLLSAPVFLEVLVLAKCPRDRQALERAVNNRLGLSELLLQPLRFEFADTEFPDGPGNGADRPSPSSICWWHGGPQEALVGGRRQGVTRRNRNCPASWPAVSQFHLLQQFLEVFAIARPNCKEQWLRGRTTSYSAAKEGPGEYALRRKRFFELCVNWPRTPRELYDFCLESTEEQKKN